MPRHVDHEHRRREVAEVAARIVAERGPDAVTVRNVARAAGYSTAVVSHYFADKRELLLATYRSSSTRHLVEAVLEQDNTDLRGALRVLLPLSEARRRDWRVYFAFWGMAIADAELAHEQRERARDVQRVLAGSVRAVREQARMDTAVDTEGVARHLLALVVGIAAQALFDPDRWSARRQHAMIDAELAHLGVAMQDERVAVGTNGGRRGRPGATPARDP